MSYVHLTPYDGQDLDETLLDQFAANSRYVHDAVEVMQLHSGHIADMRWPVDILVDETVRVSAVPRPAFPFTPAVYPNLRVDGLVDGFHTVSLVNATTPRTYKFRWFKTPQISFLTLWLIFYNGNANATTVNMLGHALEQANWS